MFYFRINKLKIFDNFEKKPLFRKRSSAEVKLISFVVTDTMKLPDFSDYQHINDPVRKKAMLKDVVTSVVDSRILTEVHNVTDNHVMKFGDTGYVLHQSEKIPECFDWNFIAYESDQDIRDVGTMIDDIIGSSSFDGFAKSVGTIIKTATAPAFTAYVEVARFAVKTIANVAKENRDDMIGMLYMSLNRREHYLHGERKKDDVPDMTNNMQIDYSIFGYE